MSSGQLPSTLFTAPPHWEWLVVLYFFVGGLAGGSYFLGVLIDLVGSWADRPLARRAYYVAFPAVVLSGILLILDLERPLRFWHMLFESNTGQPIFKYWSPMSIGSWALLLFGAFSFLAFLAGLAEAGHLRWTGLGRLRPPGGLGAVVGVVGGLTGLFVAGYTGVLLGVTNRPLWADTPLLGLLFVVSAASISAALLMLLGHQARLAGPALSAVERFDSWLLVLELLALIAVVASLGAIFRWVWISWWGLLLLVGVVGVGLLAPLVLEWRPRRFGRLSAPTAAVLVLIGGFLLRLVIVFASESV
jgi:formate-dependent nitrite reductase membrane component NrfD